MVSSPLISPKIPKSGISVVIKMAVLFDNGIAAVGYSLLNVYCKPSLPYLFSIPIVA